ncbi:hypothetical protein ACTVP2_07890 [Serratia marcescens]|uniref:hypothetical protein n=1 Tax=Serratia marcescens TaxID=615 RepID=UPI003FA6BC59
MSDNLDSFNKFTAEIFTTLLSTFPVPQYISYEKFDAKLPDDYWSNINSPEAKAAMELRSVVEGTFKFLEENGYIILNSGQDGFSNVRLTEKAMVALNMKPAALGGDETVGERIMSAVKEGTPGVLAGAVTNLLTLGINVLTQ